MIRIIFILLIFFIGYFFIKKRFPQLPNLSKQTIKKLLMGSLLIIFLSLLLTGHLNSLMALFGLGLAALLRFMPVVLRYIPYCFNLWQTFRQSHATWSATQTRTHQNNQMPPSGVKGNISVEEAYDILGLKSGASEQAIIAAHRKLMQINHPDRGGSPYLAAKINLAKQRLLKNRD